MRLSWAEETHSYGYWYCPCGLKFGWASTAYQHDTHCPRGGTIWRPVRVRPRPARAHFHRKRILSLTDELKCINDIICSGMGVPRELIMGTENYGSAVAAMRAGRR